VVLLALMLWFAGQASVRQDGTVLRAGCSQDADTVATLNAGAPVAVRFSMTGDLGTCYKVTAGDKTGYLPAAAIEGLEGYERARASAADIEAPRVIRAEVGRIRQQVAASTDVPASFGGAITLLESGQPRQALEIIETKLLPVRRDPAMLQLAGYAAYQSDQPQRAIEYWTEALKIQPNPQVEALLKKAQRELASDKSGARTSGAVFTLRYEDARVTPQVAGEMIDVLEQEYGRVSAELGCRAGEKLVAVVQAEEAYRDTTGAAGWSGGQFDGRIRIPMMYENGRVGPRMRRVFAHEIVHACLAQMGSYPAWYHEGMAQMFSGDRMSRSELSVLREAFRNGQLPKFTELAGGWSHLSADQAGMAYRMALAGMELLGADRARGLTRTPERLPQVADELNRLLMDR
jgi:tetratricopeptide (TPR) repeat protein